MCLDKPDSGRLFEVIVVYGQLFLFNRPRLGHTSPAVAADDTSGSLASLAFATALCRSPRIGLRHFSVLPSGNSEVPARRRKTRRGPSGPEARLLTELWEPARKFPGTFVSMASLSKKMNVLPKMLFLLRWSHFSARPVPTRLQSPQASKLEY